MHEHVSVNLPSLPPPYYLECGRTVYTPGQQHPNRKNLGVFDLLFIQQGILYIGEEGREWGLGAGETLLLLPDRYHYAVRPCDRDTSFYWIHFQAGGSWAETDSEAGAPMAEEQDRGRWTWPARLNSHMLSIPKSGRIYDTEKAADCFDRLMELVAKGRHAAYWEEQRLFIDLLQLLEASGHSVRTSRRVKVAEQIESYLKQHYALELNNEILAEALHYHPNYLARCMKEAYRCTPMEYVQNYRLEQAKLLLLKTDWPVARIAEQVGFRHLPYFSNCFRKHTGISPLRFRKHFEE